MSILPWKRIEDLLDFSFLYFKVISYLNICQTDLFDLPDEQAAIALNFYNHNCDTMGIIDHNNIPWCSRSDRDLFKGAKMRRVDKQNFLY
ncbi:hypothetical protein RIR_jg4423.t1 [Rhizophagus irregularis DAOM 181602=DAOM 197198]|nr:hypothetical protein RIR_jg4423.t1 [Rhizophagus irregularis DAOM 181602=DAOM 197198]